jgi:predicted DNA-binding ribbon-helix-helix protein
VAKRSIVVAGHKTSVSLEEAFRNGISGLRNLTLSELVGEVDSNHPQDNRAAIRLFVIDHFKSRTMTPEDAKSFG